MGDLGIIVGLFMFFAGVVILISVILMPFFVIAIHSELKHIVKCLNVINNKLGED